MTNYQSDGSVFNFGDLVVAEVCFAPDEDRVGRLLQVRVGVGAFGSDMFLIRARSGKMTWFHNVRLRRADDHAFVEAFYLNNGNVPPVIEPESAHPTDEPGQTYTIGGEYPETGFVIKEPRQPSQHSNKIKPEQRLNIPQGMMS